MYSAIALFQHHQRNKISLFLKLKDLWALPGVFFIIIIKTLFLFIPPVHGGLDRENCLLCHKYRGLSYIGDKEKIHLFYTGISNCRFRPHGKLDCRDCHEDIVKFPHEGVEKVNCLKECHPKTFKWAAPFSHKKVGTIVDKSVHSPLKKKEGITKCKDCHKEPLYLSSKFLQQKKITDEFLTHCMSCHNKQYNKANLQDFISSGFNEFNSRMEVINMCASCHEDPCFCKRNKLLNAIKSYKESFHGKAFYLGDLRMPICTDCHVNPGETVHAILKKEDKDASVNKQRRIEVCSADACHSSDSKKITEFYPHLIMEKQKFKFAYNLYFFFIYFTLSVFLLLMATLLLGILREIFPDFSFGRIFNTKDVS